MNALDWAIIWFCTLALFGVVLGCASLFTDIVLCDEDKSIKESCGGRICDGIDVKTGEYFKYGKTCREFKTLFVKEVD